MKERDANESFKAASAITESVFKSEIKIKNGYKWKLKILTMLFWFHATDKLYIYYYYFIFCAMHEAKTT